MNGTKGQGFEALAKEEEAALADVQRAHTTLVTAQASVAAGGAEGVETADLVTEYLAAHARLADVRNRVAAFFGRD